jgi:hypothetical protein
MAFKFYVVMQKRSDGITHCDMHKTDGSIYFTEEEALTAPVLSSDIGNSFHVVPVVAILEKEFDGMIIREP